MPEYTLNTDIFSMLRDREQYGKAGDKVTLISTRGDVLIVANSKGNRFPVHIKKVSVKEAVSQANLF